MRPQRNDDAGQRALAGVLVRAHDRARLVCQRCRGPVVPEQGPPEAGIAVELVDRHPLDRDLAIQIAPMRRQVGAIRQPRGGLEDVDLQHVSRAGTVDGDRAGEYVRAGAAVGDAVENVADARVHQQVGCIACVVGQCLDRHQVPRGDGEYRLQARVEVAPVHGRRRRDELMDGRGHDRRSCQSLPKASPPP
jgi:hypothetical protein